MKYHLSILFVVSCFVLQPGCATQETKNTKKYNFEKHYAFHSIPLWETALESFKGKSNLRYLEIGVGEGESSVWMLEHVLTHPSARMTGIDIFPGDLKKQFLANLKMSGYEHKVKIITGKSQEKLKFLPPDSFDIIYIDGSHMASNVLADAVLSWPLLKNDGFLIFDDYLMSYIKPGPERLPESLAKDTKTRIPFLPLELTPKVAADAFITAHRNNLEIIYRGYQVILKKRKNDPFFSRPNDTFLSLGKYRYFWLEKKLYSVEDKKAVPLSDDEQKLIERLFVARPFGETDFHPDEELLNDRNFIELKKRLNLDFTEKTNRSIE